MTGDIKSILLASDAAKSMRMEARVVESFSKSKWKAERGVYYNDLLTGKPREIDIHSKKYFSKKRDSKYIGAPLINLDIFCECKSLSGSNIIFADGQPSDLSMKNIDQYWIGNNDEVSVITSKFLSDLKISDPKISRAVYQHALGRAYADGGLAMRHPVSMRAPPTEMVARAFRETRNGRHSEKPSEGNRQNPIWTAIQSSMSVTKAARQKSRDACLSYIHLNDHEFSDEDAIVRAFSFFFDAELTRNSFFHSFITIDAPLWRMHEEELSQVNSVRLCIANIDDFDINIDIVNYGFIDEYVTSMVSHFEKEARRSLDALSKLMRSLEWHPGQNENCLRELLGFAVIAEDGE